MIQVRDALRFSPLAMMVVGLGLLIPFGKQMLTFLSPWLFKNFQGLVSVAEQVISKSKEQEELTEKVAIDESTFFSSYLLKGLRNAVFAHFWSKIS